MEWFQIFTADLGSPDFVLSKESARGTWISLLAYCCAQENGGRIVGAKHWPKEAWPQLCRVQAKNVAADSLLWQWDGDDLVVKYYPAKSAEKCAANRENGRLGGMRSGEARRKHRFDFASSEGEANGKQTGTSASTEKRREEKRIEEDRREEGGASAASASEEPLPAYLLALSPESAAESKRSQKGPKTPEECPEPMRSRMLAIGGLVHRRASTPWKADELAELRNQRLDAIADEEFAADLEALGAYYGLPLEAGEDYRRRELVTLLRNWPDDVAKARMRAKEWRAKHDPDGLGVAS